MNQSLETPTDPSVDLDLRAFIRPGDVVVWGQACGEPSTLTEQLVSQRDVLGGIRCFVGIPAAATLTADTVSGLSPFSYCGTGSNRALHDAGLLGIVPGHYSMLPRLLSHGNARADVVLVQVSAPDDQGQHALGLTDDYLSTAIDSARVVLVEINDQVPFTLGARTLTADDWTHAITTSRPPAEIFPTPADPVLTQVAQTVASLIDDGATLQFGIGSLPEAVLAELTDRRDLGVHSGIINNAAMALMKSGVITGARKTVDPGVAIAGFLTGTRELFEFAHRNPALQLRSTQYTHDATILAAQRQLVAINSAIEVDLTGQVNAEAIGPRYVGAVGGAMDFLRGAARSDGGIPIVALPSTARGASRIVSQLSGPVSTPRADAGVIVTEHGVADLRGTTVSERITAMIAIAHPDHRAELEHAAATHRSHTPSRAERGSQENRR